MAARMPARVTPELEQTIIDFPFSIFFLVFRPLDFEALCPIIQLTKDNDEDNDNDVGMWDK